MGGSTTAVMLTGDALTDTLIASVPPAHDTITVAVPGASPISHTTRPSGSAMLAFAGFGSVGDTLTTASSELDHEAMSLMFKTPLAL